MIWSASVWPAMPDRCFHNFRTFLATLSTLNLHNGEHQPFSIDGVTLICADYFLKGGGARYPYPKEVWTPAGNLDKLRLFVSAHSYISFINRWLVDETIKLEGKYCYFVCRDTWGVIRCLDC